VSPGIRERASVVGVNYFGFIDPSGGGKDAFTVAIAHRHDEVLILDAVRGRHGSPESVVVDIQRC